MPAKDRHHYTVIRALKKAAWDVTKEQHTLALGDRVLWIDLRAHKQNTDLAILIEIKGFETAGSSVDYLANTIGQYILYRSVLLETGDKTPLYLAVPRAAYDGILSERIGETGIRRNKIKIVVFDVETEEIIRWIPKV